MFTNDFAIISSSKGVKIIVEDALITVAGKIAIYPLYYYSKTIGYELGILEAYTGTSTQMSGFKEWAEQWHSDDIIKMKDTILNSAYNF